MPYLNKEEEVKLYICPGCKEEHKYGKCGEYCTMGCYYKVNMP